MPWELLISRSGEEPLGSRDAVVAQVATATGGEPLSLVPLPPPEALAAMPERVRAAFLTPILRALLEEDDVLVELWCVDEPVVKSLHADIRGGGDPLPLLRRLCEPGGWSVYDAADYFKLVTNGGNPASARIDLTDSHTNC